MATPSIPVGGPIVKIECPSASDQRGNGGVLGQDLDVLLCHDVLDNGRWDALLGHGLVDSLPEAVSLGLRIGQIQIAEKFLEFGQHDRVEAVIVL